MWGVCHFTTALAAASLQAAIDSAKSLSTTFIGRACFAFASELTALTAHRAIKPPLSDVAVRKFFAYGYVPAPHSILAGLRKLPGGHSLEYDLGDRKAADLEVLGFEIEPIEPRSADAEQQWCEQLRALLATAVKRRLISDVPIGAFLSGGIDSSAVSAFAARALGSNTLNTYSIAFEEPSFDESRTRDALPSSCAAATTSRRSRSTLHAK
jgi:asparagine synthase (glutamine-hydrolysing)